MSDCKECKYLLRNGVGETLMPAYCFVNIGESIPQPDSSVARVHPDMHKNCASFEPRPKEIDDCCADCLHLNKELYRNVGEAYCTRFMPELNVGHSRRSNFCIFRKV